MHFCRKIHQVLSKGKTFSLKKSLKAIVQFKMNGNLIFIDSIVIYCSLFQLYFQECRSCKFISENVVCVCGGGVEVCVECGVCVGCVCGGGGGCVWVCGGVCVCVLCYRARKDHLKFINFVIYCQHLCSL